MSISIHAREAAPYPKVRERKSSTLEAVKQLPDRTKKIGKCTVGLAGGVLFGGIFVMTGQVEAENDNCTDATHQQIVAEDGFRATVRGTFELGGLIEGEQTATGIAKTLANSRGYSISEAQLRSVNKPVLFENETLESGVYCIDVPGPVFSGFTRADGHTSLKEMAAANLTTVENLHKLNPSLEGVLPDADLEDGRVVRVDLDIDKSYVYREMTDKEADINTLADGNAKLRNKILAKNGAILGSGGSVSHGSDAWLPVKETKWMAEHDITVREIARAYTIASYQKVSPENHTNRSMDRSEAVLSGFEHGFTKNVLSAARREIRKWPKGQTDNWNDAENSNPYIAKYTGGPLGAKESWCADFLRYTLNQAGAGIDVVENIDGQEFLMRRVRDVYKWMVDGENGSFYVYKRESILEDRKTTYKPGDIIFFNDKGSEENFMASKGNHVGIISGVNGNELSIIDGNYADLDNVSERTIAANDKQIVAIARPIEARQTMSSIDIPPQQNETPELSRKATDALFERGPDWENRAVAMRFFMDYGLEDYQAAALIGNFIIETGDESLPAGQPQYGGGPGRGLAQWEKGGRFDTERENLVEFADSLGKQWYELATQLAFVVHEFETTERAAYADLKKTPGVYEATYSVLNKYERPAERKIDKRLIATEKTLAAYRNAVIDSRSSVTS